jgi:hypothetical protein
VDEITQLAQAQVGDEVLLAYIEQSSGAYDLDVDHILYLHDVGLSAEVIAAMVRKGQTPAASVEPAAPATVAAANAPAESVRAPAPAVTEAPAAAAPAEPAVPITTTEAPQQITNNYFYNTLSPYGTWLEDADYGWCWRPTVAVVQVDWRPYCHGGRWIYSDCGWYWQSYYSWGWAPFHYGRWYMRPSFGWVWVPDTCWGPAWVTWRYSSGYCGWAPLPPRSYVNVGFGYTYGGVNVGFGFDFGLAYGCYTFVPNSHFYHPTPWAHCVAPRHVPGIFGHTTVVNTYVHGSGNNTIVNVGPNAQLFAAGGRNEIRKVSIRDVRPGPGAVIRADRMEADGGSLAVYRPNLPQQASAPPPEITRRQQEVRRNSEQLAGSDRVRVARANAASSIAPRSSAPAGQTRSPNAPRIVRVGPETSGAGVANGPNNPVTATPSTRSEPRRVDAPTAPAPRGNNLSPQTVTPAPNASPTVVRPSNSTTRPETSRPTSPQVVPSRPTQNRVSQAPAVSPRSEPPRRMETPRPTEPTTSVAPQAYQPVQPRQPSPRTSVAPTPGYTPPAVRAPSYSPPAPRTPATPSMAPSPVIRSQSPPATTVPSRPSFAPSYTPAPAPSRPTAAPTPAPSSGSSSRSGGGRQER